MALHPRAKEAVGTVVYEMKMFDWLVDRIEAEWAAAAQESRNLLLEGLLLHARTLRDFFLNARRRDDVVAADYFDDAAAWDRDGLCRYTVRHSHGFTNSPAHIPRGAALAAASSST